MSGKLVIYDTEIMRCIRGKGEKKDPSYEYCRGWGDHEGMGISELCALVVEEDHYEIKSHGPVSDKRELIEWWTGIYQSGDLLCSFNGRRFDDRLMAANGMPVSTQYDIYTATKAAVKKQTGSKPQKGRSYSMGKIAQANEGFYKDTFSANAPQLYQDGEQERVTQGCRADVLLEGKIMAAGIAGKLRDPHVGGLALQLPIPPNKWASALRGLQRLP